MYCQICNKPTKAFEDEKSKIPYDFCPHCEFLSKSPELYPDFKTQKIRYNLHQNNEEDIAYQAYFQHFLDFILAFLDRNIKEALDFGCGKSTLLSQMLEKEGIHCEYYDPIYHPHNLDKKYDLIVSTEVFEHLHSPKEIFASLLQKLNKGGFLAIQTQFHPNNEEDFKKWYYHKDPTHIVFFRLKTFEVLAKMYGAEIIGDNAKNMLIIRK